MFKVSFLEQSPLLLTMNTITVLLYIMFFHVYPSLTYLIWIYFTKYENIFKLMRFHPPPILEDLQFRPNIRFLYPRKSLFNKIFKIIQRKPQKNHFLEAVLLRRGCGGGSVIKELFLRP